MYRNFANIEFQVTEEKSVQEGIQSAWETICSFTSLIPAKAQESRAKCPKNKTILVQLQNSELSQELSVTGWKTKLPDIFPTNVGDWGSSVSLMCLWAYCGHDPEVCNSTQPAAYMLLSEPFRKSVGHA